MTRAIIILAILLPLSLASCRQLQGPPAVKIGFVHAGITGAE